MAANTSFHYGAKLLVAGAISAHHTAPREDRVHHSCSPLNAQDEHPGARSLLNFHPRCNGAREKVWRVNNHGSLRGAR